MPSFLGSLPEEAFPSNNLETNKQTNGQMAINAHSIIEFSRIFAEALAAAAQFA